MRSACTPRQGPSHPPPRHRLWQRLEATLAQGSRKTSTWRSWHSPRPLPRPCSRSTRRSTRRRRPGHTRQRAHVLGAGRSCLRAGDRREHAAAVGRGGNSGLRRRWYVCTTVHAASSLGKELSVFSVWRLPLPTTQSKRWRKITWTRSTTQPAYRASCLGTKARRRACRRPPPCLPCRSRDVGCRHACSPPSLTLRHTPRAQNNRCAQCAARRLCCSTAL